MSDRASSTAISVRNVHLRFGSLVVLNGLNLDVFEGETVGLVGPNGAGKTSLLNCINRVYRPQQGQIEFYGASLDRKRPDQVAELGLARTFQLTTVFRGIKVIDLVLLGRHVRLKPSFLSYMAGIPVFNGYESRERQYCMKFIDFVGLRRVAEYNVGDLPYGLAKLADLARALALEPRVLLLDEPASGLSSEERATMAGVLKRIQDELRVTQLLVEHDMTLVNRVCNRLVVMKDGAKVADGVPATVVQSAEVIDALLGFSGVPDERDP